jgi:hypothetical protein
MKHIAILPFMALALSCQIIETGQVKKLPHAAITYLLDAGRFGDNIRIYMRAKWLSYNHKVPLLYQPFEYSNDLALHNIEQHYDEILTKNFEATINLKNEDEIQASTPNIYQKNRRTKINTPDEKKILKFFEELKHLIKPSFSIEKIITPTNRMSVGVHVRQGGGFDSPTIIKKHRLRFLPIDYYIEQIKQLSTMLNNVPLHVHIFTDDSDPNAIMETIKSRVQKTNITYSCRDTENSHDKNVLEDFFGMIHCDYLIRPASNFSIAAQILGNHKIVLAPKQTAWISGQAIIIDTAKIITPQEKISVLTSFLNTF